ncbi:MAG: hypothetical protein K6U88_11320 [Dehalococcoidia bacterium]|nr:hypothetical protein [Dehalococcoidia bacterium]
MQELEVARREKELEATIAKQAEAEQRRIEILAEAQRQKLAREAQGQAEALRQQGAAQAEVTRLTGAAEADIIRAKGQAEADAMHLKADAYLQYNQAAIIDKFLTGMPEVARAMASALGGVDKVTVVSTGTGAQGVSALTGEVAKMIAQVPELFETLTGMKVSELLGRLQQLDASAAASTNGAAERRSLDIPVVRASEERGGAGG